MLRTTRRRVARYVPLHSEKQDEEHNGCESKRATEQQDVLQVLHQEPLVKTTGTLRFRSQTSLLLFGFGSIGRARQPDLQPQLATKRDDSCLARCCQCFAISRQTMIRGQSDGARRRADDVHWAPYGQGESDQTCFVRPWSTLCLCMSGSTATATDRRRLVVFFPPYEEQTNQ
jgi:hypothetical protein